MTDNNKGDLDLFKYQLEDKQKIIILHILRNFPQEIKSKICEAINHAIDEYLLGTQHDKNFYLGSSDYIWGNYGYSLSIPSSSKNHIKDKYQLPYFKEHTLKETKILIFKILKELPKEVHQPILIILDQYEEWKMIDDLTNESSELEQEYNRQLLKQLSSELRVQYFSN